MIFKISVFFLFLFCYLVEVSNSWPGMQPNTGHSIETPEHQNWTYFSESEIFGLLTLHYRYTPPYQPLPSFVVSFEQKNLFRFPFFLNLILIYFDLFKLFYKHVLISCNFQTILSFCFFAEV